MVGAFNTTLSVNKRKTKKKGLRRTYDQTQGVATKICVVLPNVRPRLSVKGAIQINAIIWSDFYCRTKLVASVKRA